LIKATLEHLNQGICIFDEQNRLVGSNRRAGELLALPASKLQLGTFFGSLYDMIREDVSFLGETQHADVEAWADSSAKRAPLSFEIGIGSDRTLAVFAQQMPDRGFVISFTDVSAERAAVRAIARANETLEQRVAARTLELEDALSEAERANASKSRFVAAASHDLLQPLSAAKLYVASLEDDLENPELKERLSKAGNALVSVERILAALLDISKLDSGLASVDLSTICLKDMLNQLNDELQPLAMRKGLNFRLVCCDALVESDASYLRRILQNLASNAIRYTEAGKVLIGVRHSNSTVRVEIWDTGPGIPEDQQEKVFDEFHRLNADASPSEGMGLGLAIVERACRLLKHPLQLTSHPDQGTCFSVELPRSLAARRHAPAKALPSQGRSLEHRIAVLIENDAELRSAMSITMENWGLDVLPCASQSEAEEVLREVDIAPDVIVADFQLDDGALGTDAISDLRTAYGPVPACLVTANRSPDLHGTCDKLGVTLIHKPIDPNVLRGFMEAVLPA
jgi:signal transduction histidine kinase/CheY-like chemotaxis protein